MPSGSKFLYADFADPRPKARAERSAIRWLTYIACVQLVLQVALFLLVLGERF